MGKKKIIGLCLAVGLMVGVVGGSLAWFTDTDTVTNSFSTGNDGNPDDNGKKGIVIVENWNADDAKNILPGTDVNKDVEVKNTASYSQLIRVKFTKTTNKEGLKLDEVDLRFTDFSTNKWIKNTENGVDWYYYNGVVESGASTTRLLDSVKLLNSAGKEYKDAAFDVVVDAEGVQATNGAVQEVWKSAPDAIKKLGGELVQD